MQELQQMWEKVLSKIDAMVSIVSYELWIEPIVPLDMKDNLLILSTNSITAKRQLLKNHTKELSECIESVFGEEVKFEVLDPTEKEEYLSKNKPDDSKSVLNDEEDETKNMFNSKYTFDNFVVGKSNQFCYAAARAVAENPGTKFNPLFIYGGVGLGKTHLMHAIGNYIKQNYPKLKIQYVTIEKFTNDYIDSLHGNNKEKSISSFREKYRNVDVLMVDDIQIIKNKTETQEEFFHTFNDLYQCNKQIVIASDRPPKEIATLSDRLVSRFTSGLIQDMQSPDFETRVAILRKKAQLERYYIDDDVIDFIAEKVDTNIREMEGLLSKVYFFATLLGKKSATIEEAREAFKEQQNVQKEKLTPESIIETVCSYYGIEYSEITGKKKSKEIVEPRMVAIYLISEMLEIPLVSIGKLFGGRDHTTIIHARDKITEQMKTDKKTQVVVADIKKQIGEIC